MKSQWPTLKGRLENAPATELDALEQLAKSIPLSPAGTKRLERLRKKNKKKI